MNQKILIVWALVATGAALYFAGLQTGKKSAAPAPTMRMSSPTMSTDDSSPTPNAAPSYQIPEALAGLPRYWRSPITGEQTEGYAALFDVRSRKVIIEQCRHHGWYDERNKRAADIAQPFCQTIVHVTLAAWSDNVATAIDRDGQALKIAATLSSEGDELSLVLPNQTMTLIAGTTNDMLQAMEAAPGLQEQRKKYLLGTIDKRPSAPGAAADRPPAPEATDRS